MPKLKKSGDKKVAPLFTVDDMFSMGREYAEVSSKTKELNAKKDDLSDKIKTCVKYYGTKDDKGSYYIEDKDHTLLLGSVAKVKVSLDQEKGVAILRELGLESCIKEETKYTIDEGALSEAVSSGKISLNKVQEFTIKSEPSYSVLVKTMEEMPEVEQTTLKSVARRKKNG